MSLGRVGLSSSLRSQLDSPRRRRARPFPELVNALSGLRPEEKT
jgi:hypothetical protein